MFSFISTILNGMETHDLTTVITLEMPVWDAMCRYNQRPLQQCTLSARPHAVIRVAVMLTIIQWIVS